MTTALVGRWLGGLKLGEAWKEGRVEIVGLYRDESGGAAGFRLADEAFEAGELEVIERGEGGVVQELLARNKGELPVLLLEGDTLLGAKQNRLVARSILIAAGAQVVVPVGCMERGRWRHTSRGFSSAAYRAEPSLRRENIKDVSRSRSSGRSPSLDQGRLWNAVEEKLHSRRRASATSDYTAALHEPAETVADKLRERPIHPGEIGALVLVEGHLVAIELTSDERSWQRLARRTLPSTTLEATELPVRGPGRAASEWVESLLKAEFALQEAAGLGSDITVSGQGFVGAGLWDGEKPAHLAVYADVD